MVEAEGRRAGGQRIEVVAVDPVSVGYSHAMFNAAIVRALDAASIVERVHVLVAKSALESKAFGGVAALPKVKVREALPEGSNGRGRSGQIKRIRGLPRADVSRGALEAIGCQRAPGGGQFDRPAVVAVRQARARWMRIRNIAQQRPRGQSVAGDQIAVGPACSGPVCGRSFWRNRYTISTAGCIPTPGSTSFHTRHTTTGPRPSEGDREPRNFDQQFLFLGRHGRSATTVEFLRSVHFGVLGSV